MPIGTAAYMSPEQVRGQAVDKRTDIWAFGCVVYEMLTAMRAFDGDTVSDTLSNVLTRQPDLARVPARVRPLLRSCLEQDARRRLRDIGDCWRLLEEPALVRPQRNYLPWAIPAIATAGAALASWNWSRTSLPQEAPLEPSVRIALDLGPELSVATNSPCSRCRPTVSASCSSRRIRLVSLTLRPSGSTRESPPRCPARKARMRRSSRRTGSGSAFSRKGS